MSTELHAALRAAVSDSPFDESDLRTVVETGSRRVRRRSALRIGASAAVVAVAVAVTSVVAARSDHPEREPQPAHVVRLDLSEATEQDLDVLGSVRTTHRDPMNDISHDRFEGLTTDGLVLRERYTYNGNSYELGLLDPETGTTDWLPPAPVAAEVIGVDLSADRLVLVARERVRTNALLVFDRRSRTWASSPLRLAGGLEVHAPPRLLFGTDDRVYLGTNYEGESGPLHWWSFAVPEGGVGRPEPALDGMAAAWGDGIRAVAGNDGRVVLSSSGAERIVAEKRPAGCDRPADPDLAEMPVSVGLAGNRPVVTYFCGDEPESVTLVYGVDGGETLQIADATFLAADQSHVLLAPFSNDGRDNLRGLYLLDLDRRTLTRFGPGIHEWDVDVAGGLVQWNQPGPIDAKDVYDVVWNVARVPVND
jgi:hypothetical protein